jgi:hypothetical protein
LFGLLCAWRKVQILHQQQPFIDFIRNQKVPSDKNMAEQLVCQTKSYVLVGDKL